jgi:hypothetical protein
VGQGQQRQIPYVGKPELTVPKSSGAFPPIDQGVLIARIKGSSERAVDLTYMGMYVFLLALKKQECYVRQESIFLIFLEKNKQERCKNDKE